METTIESLKQIEYPKLDLSEFEGTKVSIHEVILKEMPSKFSETGKQMCLKVISNPVTSIPASNDQEADIEICASELFNITADSEGNYGWGEKSALAAFLKKMKVNHPKELIGKKATIRKYTKEVNGKEKDFLGFIKE